MYTIESFLSLHSRMFKGLLTVIFYAEGWKDFVRSLDCPHLCFYKFRLACTKIIVNFDQPGLLFLDLIRFEFLHCCLRISVFNLDSQTHYSKLILCAGDAVMTFRNGPFASRLRKDPWRTARRQCSMPKSICKYKYLFCLPLVCAWRIIFFLSATLSKELSRSRATWWTRTLFIWSTTLSGQVSAKRKRQALPWPWVEPGGILRLVIPDWADSAVGSYIH